MHFAWHYDRRLFIFIDYRYLDAGIYRGSTRMSADQEEDRVIARDREIG